MITIFRNKALHQVCIWLGSITAGVMLCVVFAFSFNGFDVSEHNIPLEEIFPGGPTRDGIPALLTPVFIPASEATFLVDEDRVLGLKKGNETKVYPIKILNWHEIVNDTVKGAPIVVTYCPLCGTGIGFIGMVNGEKVTFGVSGLLYQSDLLMYDHQTESLWSQIAMEAVADPMTGARLHHLFLEHTTLGDWKKNHPQSLVLSDKTGYHRDYDRDPYFGYAQRADLMFSTRKSDGRFHPKEWVVGVELEGVFKAYPFSELRKQKGSLKDNVNGYNVVVQYNHKAQSAIVVDTKWNLIPSVMAYWFAWYAFHQDTLVFHGKP